MMAFSDFEQKRYAKIVSAYVETRRPPVHIRGELDIGFRIVGQSIEIFETRPVWQSPDESVENPIIKATYVKRSDVWRIFWQRADLRWHRYDPLLWPSNVGRECRGDLAGFLGSLTSRRMTGVGRFLPVGLDSGTAAFEQITCFL